MSKLAERATSQPHATIRNHFRADLETEQFAFELYGIFLSFHLYHRLLRDPETGRRARDAFESLLESSR